MTQALSHVNWLAALAASVAHFVLGGIWFAALFGKQYGAALGIADRPPQKSGAIFIIAPFVCGAVTIATTAPLLHALGIMTYGDALTLGLLVRVGCLSAMTLSIAINPPLPRPFAYALINTPMFPAAISLGQLLPSPRRTYPPWS